jgi:hypothetical protein
MADLFPTLIIAFMLVVLAIAALAIGWLLTGKSRIERGACGRDPTKRQDEACSKDVSCGLCEKPKSSDQNKDPKKNQ